MGQGGGEIGEDKCGQVWTDCVDNVPGLQAMMLDSSLMRHCGVCPAERESYTHFPATIFPSYLHVVLALSVPRQPDLASLGHTSLAHLRGGRMCVGGSGMHRGGLGRRTDDKAK